MVIRFLCTIFLQPVPQCRLPNTHKLETYMKSIRMLMVLSMFAFVLSGCASKETPAEETMETETMESTDMSQPADTTVAADSSAVSQ